MESPLCRLCGTRHWSRQGCPAKAFKSEPPIKKDVVVLEPVKRRAKGKRPALTPAEKQKRYRERHGDRVREFNRLRMARKRKGE
jgi:hypothetical protein